MPRVLVIWKPPEVSRRRTRNGSPKGDALHVHVVDLESLLEKPSKLSKELLRHTVAQKDACEGVVNLGGATDKDHFGALAVAPFIYSLGAKNLAFVGVPQVPGRVGYPPGSHPWTAEKNRMGFSVYSGFGV